MASAPDLFQKVIKKIDVIFCEELGLTPNDEWGIGEALVYQSSKPLTDDKVKELLKRAFAEVGLGVQLTSDNSVIEGAIRLGAELIGSLSASNHTESTMLLLISLTPCGSAAR